MSRLHQVRCTAAIGALGSGFGQCFQSANDLHVSRRRGLRLNLKTVLYPQWRTLDDVAVAVYPREQTRFGFDICPDVFQEYDVPASSRAKEVSQQQAWDAPSGG